MIIKVKTLDFFEKVWRRSPNDFMFVFQGAYH